METEMQIWNRYVTRLNDLNAYLRPAVSYEIAKNRSDTQATAQRAVKTAIETYKIAVEQAEKLREIFVYMNGK